MEQPERTLENGTKIRTHAHLARADGMMVHHAHLAARTANATGEIAGVVGGHGGDVYWVRHGSDECLAAYCFNEFERAVTSESTNETPAEAHARGVTEERARWVGWCERVMTASKAYSVDAMGTGARDALRMLAERIGEEP
jgi:hypothetical protein